MSRSALKITLLQVVKYTFVKDITSIQKCLSDSVVRFYRNFDTLLASNFTRNMVNIFRIFQESIWNSKV